ncbi:MAG: AAA family ATPase, partial [Chloroflexota bacterium]|nr:AAA family ATPase [Chloroflexota bacterium]
PQPIPVELKVIMLGDETNYRLLSTYDREDFWEMFKVKAEFDYQIDRSPDTVRDYGAFICGACNTEGLLHFDKTGVAKVLEQAARAVDDQARLSTRFGQIKDLLIEADYWARKSSSPLVTSQHVLKALDEKVYRLNLIEERLRRLITDGTLMVDVAGKVVGQVNGLVVYDLGDFRFGRPTRITAKTFAGRRGVVNIEREIQLSGPIHDKGVLILGGYLGHKYAQEKPLSLSASICFEQSYEGVEGDSASSTELYAILSSLSGLPLSQEIAVTGSVNQKGEVQPIGGVNQKIEGFYDVCRVVGLTGRQGVLMPTTNLRHLMLREDVAQAVGDGHFHIYAVSSIDEGMEVLTGRRAGQRRADGAYPRATVNYLVQKRLAELGESLRGYYAAIMEEGR